MLKSAKSIGYLLAIAALSGCASTRDPGFVMAGHSRLSESAAELSTQADKERDARSAEAEGLDERDSDESKPDVQLGSGAFINQAAAARGPATDLPPPPTCVRGRGGGACAGLASPSPVRIASPRASRHVLKVRKRVRDAATEVRDHGSFGYLDRI